MKYIQIVPFYPLPTAQTFKSDYFLWPAVMMKERGFECEFVTLRSKGKKAHELVEGFSVRRFPNTLKLLLYVQKQNALVHAHLRPYKPSLFSALLRKKKLITPFTYELGSNILIKALSVFLMKRFNRVIPISPYEKEVYIKHGFRMEKVKWIPLAIDYDLFAKAKKDKAVEKKLGLKGDYDFTVITVANFRYFKRIDILLRAFKELKESVKLSRLIIVGDDWLAQEKKPTIREMIKALGLKDVVLTGYQRSEVISRVLKHADVFVNTSSVESQCIAAYEAAASDLPLSLSDIPSFTYVFKENALYHRYYDYKQLAKNLLRYYKDKTLARRNAAAVKKLVRSWDQRFVKRKLWKVYQELLS